MERILEGEEGMNGSRKERTRRKGGKERKDKRGGTEVTRRGLDGEEGRNKSSEKRTTRTVGEERKKGGRKKRGEETKGVKDGKIF